MGQSAKHTQRHASPPSRKKRKPFSSRHSPFSPPPKPKDCLVIFAKAPIPGQVKTRLCPPLTPDEAASLHGSVVLDMLERTRLCQQFNRILACAPSKEHPFFRTVGARYRIQLIDQYGDDLGERMSQAFLTTFAQGHQNVLLIGTDIPSLQPSVFEQARNLLATHDVVLGPTYDGGYYLIGLQAPHAALFTGIPWSTDQVFSLTHAKATSLGLSVGLLGQERDLDTFHDIQILTRDLKRAGNHAISPRTCGVLQALTIRIPERELHISQSTS